MALSDGKPLRTLSPNLRIVYGTYTGAGAANMVKLTGRGIASVNYNSATGKYLITFTDVGAEIRSCKITVHNNTAGAAPLVGSAQITTFSTSAKTLPFETWDLAAPGLANVTSVMTCHIEVIFSDTTNAQGG